MARLVEGHRAALVLRHHLVLLLQAADDAIHGALEVHHGNVVLVRARRHQRRLVADVGDVRPGKPGGERGEALRVVVAPLHQLQVLEVHVEDLRATLDVRAVDGDLTVETPRSQKSLVQDVRPVRARQHHDALGGGKAVHLHQELVERVFALVVATSKSLPPTRAPDGVNLVDEDDGRALGARLREQVAHARRPYAHKHLHEVRPGD
mmetsp:Transcript_24503/g.46451  ORF Transcript_24503/g.46451 Transcript_24503/m.46451 type:complete len:207 (+) Transcript_24503:1084-1704(+)